MIVELTSLAGGVRGAGIVPRRGRGGRAAHKSKANEGAHLMAQTLAEQILSNAAGRPVQAGENVVVNVDLAMMHDSISPSIIKVLHGELGTERVWDPARIAVVVDHVAPAATIQTAEHQAHLRRWVREQGITHLYDVGRGIS